MHMPFGTQLRGTKTVIDAATGQNGDAEPLPSVACIYLCLKSYVLTIGPTKDLHPYPRNGVGRAVSRCKILYISKSRIDRSLF